jgi:cobalt-zinc-cadmium efflux system outer membrane protein
MQRLGIHAAVVCTAALALCAPAATAMAQSMAQSGARDSLVLSLAEVERRVLRESPALRAAHLDTALARGDLITAALRLNPSVNVQADILPTRLSGYDPNQKQYGLQLVLPIERGNKRALRTHVAEAAVQATDARVRDVDREQLLAARLAWVDLQAAYAALHVSESTLSSFDRLVALNRSRLDARQISEAEFSRVVIERDRVAVDVDERRLDVQSASTSLAALMGIDARVVPRDSLQPIALSRSIVPDTVMQLALATRPDVRAARAGVQTADADQRLQTALATPDIAVSLDYSMQQTIPLYGASFSVPLPRFNRNQGEREKARVRFEQARLALGATERAVRADVQRALDAVTSRRATLTRFERDDQDGILRRAATAKTTAEFAYRSGATSLLELLDVERSYDDIRRAYVDAMAQYNRSVARLDEAIGRMPENQP